MMFAPEPFSLISNVNRLCKYMECEDTDAEAMLIGGAAVDFSHGLDVAVDLSIDKDPATQRYAFTMHTSIPGLDDRITWTISSSFLTKVASAAKEAADNLSSLQQYISIDNSDLVKVVALLNAVGIDKDRTRDAISVSQFLSVFGVTNIGAFIHKVAGADFDDLDDLKLVLPQLPFNETCMQSSWATRSLPPLTTQTLFDIASHNKTSFTIPPICKSVSEESEGWIKTVQLYDMEVADLFVNKVETSMDVSNVNEGHREINIDVTGITGNIGLAFKVNVWALGVIEAKASVVLNDYSTRLYLPIENATIASNFREAKINKELRTCSLSETGIDISFQTDGFYWGLFTVAGPVSFPLSLWYKCENANDLDTDSSMTFRRSNILSGNIWDRCFA